MESLKALERIQREAVTPYFSTLYDIDMWREDFAKVKEELEILEILKSLLFFVPSQYENQANWGNEYISMSYLDKTWTRPEIYEKVKQWCFENEIRGIKENYD